MQTTHHTANQPVNNAAEPGAAPGRRPFKTHEQEVFEKDRSAWIQEQIAKPIFGAVFREAQNATRQGSADRVFFEHYLAFFRDAELLELPIEGDFLNDWLALAFESAYDLARQDPGRAEAWLDECPSDRGLAERKLQTFKSQSRRPDQKAHAFVKSAIQRGHFGGQPVQENKATPASLLSEVEGFFWTGLFAATEARHDPEAMDMVAWFDEASANHWNDGRFHTRLIREAPLRGKEAVSGFFKHPLLRIAAEKYKRSPHEGAAIGGLLEHLCGRYGIRSEKESIWRDLHLAQWVRNAAQWGAWIIREHPDSVRQILDTTTGYTGDHLSRFYGDVLEGVEDINDFVEVTLAFLSWQSQQRGDAMTRYHGERMETIVECVDAGAWLSWWLAQESADLTADKAPESNEADHD